MRPTKIKTKNNHGSQNHAFLCFRTVEEKENAVKIFDGYQWKGREIKVKEAKALLDPLVKRRFEEKNLDENGPRPKKLKKKTILEATVPLAHIPYEEQLKRKKINFPFVHHWIGINFHFLCYFSRRQGNRVHKVFANICGCGEKSITRTTSADSSK